MIPPPLGITAQVTPKSNYDGDTARFIFQQEANIRITNATGDFDTPELGHRAKNDAEAWLGEKAKEKVDEYIFSADEIRVLIPAGKAGVMGDSFAIGTRVAGIVYCRYQDSWINLADEITKLGLTKRDAEILHMCEQAYSNHKFIRFSSLHEHKDMIEHMKEDCGFAIKNEFKLFRPVMTKWGPEYLREKFNTLTKPIGYLVLFTGFNDDEHLLGIR